MSSIFSASSTWETIKELDLRPIRDQALRGVGIALVGAPGSGRTTLAGQMRRDPKRPDLETDTPVLILDLDHTEPAARADLIILVVDSRSPDSAREQELVKAWHNSGKKVLVFINQFEDPQQAVSVSPTAARGKRRVVWGSALDTEFLLQRFVPVVVEMLREHALSLGRYFPLFRLAVANYLINDTSFSNAAYSLSTALAETVAILDIPIAMTDMVVLTKTQAFLIYKLGLALGFSTRWQDYITEFGGVLGNGFVWRQIARTLVGFIPVWGILPKTAISYAGTYVIGHGVLQWYLTGRHISKDQMRQLYTQAFERGKVFASNLLHRLPRPRLPKISRPRLPKISRPRLPRRKPRQLPAETPVMRACPTCGKSNAADASFCQYCGTSFPVVEKT